MKIIVDSKVEGLVSLLGERVILFCANYFYTGKLSGVNKLTVKLDDPQIVYETGPFSDKQWKDAQSMHVPELYVRIPMIESFCKIGK
jgi:hypothetical protein